MAQTQLQSKNWRMVELGTLCAIDTGKKDVNEGGEGGKYPFFTCARETLKSNDYSFDTDAILVVGNGSYTGFTKKYSGKFDLYQRTYALHDFDKSADFKFLYYYLKENFESKYMGGSHGAAIPYITKPILTDFEILLPLLPTQKQIADVLSAYDDLIENNTKRIKILEETAQAIYKEWFVYFRFPRLRRGFGGQAGHEKVKMIDSKTEFGKIPEGWKVGTLSDLVTNVRDSTPSGEILKDRRYVPIDLIDSQTLTLRKYNSWTEAKSSLILFEKGDVLFGAMRPYFHKVAIAPFSGVTRGTCLVLRPKYDIEFCALTLFGKEVIDFATANSQGATIPYINWNVLAKKQCLIPSINIISAYSKIVQPTLKLTQTLARTHEKLSMSRDQLLPKLVTGEIEI